MIQNNTNLVSKMKKKITKPVLMVAVAASVIGFSTITSLLPIGSLIMIVVGIYFKKWKTAAISGSILLVYIYPTTILLAAVILVAIFVVKLRKAGSKEVSS